MRLREKPRQHTRQLVLLVEEAGSANANRAVLPGGQRLRQRWFLENKGLFHSAHTARELGGKQPGMRTGTQRRGQKSSEERVVCGVGEIAWRVALLPATPAEIGLERRQQPVVIRLLRGIEAQCIQRDKE